MSESNFRNLILKDIYNILKLKKIDFICINDPFYGLVEKGDIDIIIKKNQIKNALEYIKSFLGNKKDILFFERSSLSTNYCLNSKFLIEIKNSNIPLIQIDIMDSFHWRGFVYADYEILRRFIITKKNIYCLEKNACDCIGALKDILYKQKILDKRNLSNKLDSVLSFLVELGFSKTMSKKFFNQFLKKKNIKMYFLLMWAENISLSSLKSFFLFYINIINSLRKGIYKNQLIAFYGPDGAGKSYLIDCLSKQEILREYFDIIRIGHTSKKVLPELGKIKKLLPYKEGKENKSLRSTVPLSKLECIIHVIYYGIEYFYENLVLHINRFVPKRILYIYDRYVFEKAYQQTFLKLPPIFINYLKLFSYLPLINFFIYARTDIIHSRKKELSVSEINYQINKFREIDYKFNLQSVFINNSSNDITKTVKQIIHKVRDNLN